MKDWNWRRFFVVLLISLAGLGMIGGCDSGKKVVDEVSGNRAVNVRGTLIGLGVPENQIQTAAFGESAPKAPNLNPDGTDNPSGRAQNRRAEVYLQF